MAGIGLELVVDGESGALNFDNVMFKNIIDE
jgi:hypothetical protein